MKTENKMVTDVATVKFSVRRLADGTCDCVVSTEDANDSDFTGYAKFLAKYIVEYVDACRHVFGDAVVKDTDGILKTNWPRGDDKKQGE